MISSANASSLSCNPAFLRNSHSHTVITVHPRASRCAVVTSSQCRFLAIFSSQNSTFDFGLVAYRHPLCPCQKHPFTIIATPYFGRTISGLPGSLRSCSRNLNPRACSPFLTRISGLVFLPRMRDMHLWRWDGVNLSGTRNQATRVSQLKL